MYWQPNSRNNKVKVISSDKYKIHIGKESISNLVFSEYSQIAILVDENTKRECLPLLIKKSPSLKNTLVIKINSGEENKNMTSCNYIWEKLIEYNFDRNALLINLGGGVIGDLGGYAASCYKRGIDFIQIPTTLLAMVDASIGGKVGINHQHLKNQIGLFKNPLFVFINPEFLDTLKDSELKSGFSEIIKHCLIANKNKWESLKKINFNNVNWESIISDSIEIKNNIVLSDPKEKNDRKKLNFGHTFAHAIEAFYIKKGTPISHGNAVLLGILMEIEISKLSSNEKIEIKEFILSNFDLPYLPEKKDLIIYIKHDKKNKKDKINFSLLDGIGRCSINNFFLDNDI